MNRLQSALLFTLIPPFARGEDAKLKEKVFLSKFKELLPTWFRDGKNVEVSYTCGEINEEDKRKNFPGFSETNCQCLDFTFEYESRLPWQNR